MKMNNNGNNQTIRIAFIGSLLLIFNIQVIYATTGCVTSTDVYPSSATIMQGLCTVSTNYSTSLEIDALVLIPSGAILDLQLLITSLSNDVYAAFTFSYRNGAGSSSPYLLTASVAPCQVPALSDGTGQFNIALIITGVDCTNPLDSPGCAAGSTVTTVNTLLSVVQFPFGFPVQLPPQGGYIALDLLDDNPNQAYTVTIVINYSGNHVNDSLIWAVGDHCVTNPVPVSTKFFLPATDSNFLEMVTDVAPGRIFMQLLGSTCCSDITVITTAAASYVGSCSSTSGYCSHTLPSINPNASMSATPTASRVASPSIFPSGIPSPRANTSVGATPSATPTIVANASVSASPVASPSGIQVPSPSANASVSTLPNASPSANTSVGATASATPTVVANTSSVSPAPSGSAPSVSQVPSVSPSTNASPSTSPSASPSVNQAPSVSPSSNVSPSTSPSASASTHASVSLSPLPTSSTSSSPSSSPSVSVSTSPSSAAHVSPSHTPSKSPSQSRSPSRSPSSSSSNSPIPSVSPQIRSPSSTSSPLPSRHPSSSSSGLPSVDPSTAPSEDPSSTPSSDPSGSSSDSGPDVVTLVVIFVVLGTAAVLTAIVATYLVMKRRMMAVGERQPLVNPQQNAL